MKRSPLARRTPLRPKTPLKQGSSQLKRTPLKRKPASDAAQAAEFRRVVLGRSDRCQVGAPGCAVRAVAGARRKRVEFPPSVRAEVRRRAGDRCERCRVAPIDHFHHRLMRSQGGGGTIENCAGFCLGCHERVHLQPAESYSAGWLIRRSDARGES